MGIREYYIGFNVADEIIQFLQIKDKLCSILRDYYVVNNDLDYHNNKEDYIKLLNFVNKHPFAYENKGENLGDFGVQIIGFEYIKNKIWTIVHTYTAGEDFLQAILYSHFKKIYFVKYGYISEKIKRYEPILFDDDCIDDEKKICDLFNQMKKKYNIDDKISMLDQNGNIINDDDDDIFYGEIMLR
ncbi:MAG: hypothetical protein Edafosvirus2_88 [Edafosvirus sp.]|uniref:Uncharacterized protein n=1 Tax=Edafosvirus sp. TaxID=2487765 RepID=A0A3G4ZWW2_9VIRU|nr:MAG: hypothetical protein Edafosvirus2_88 [Edafosvirus sp.]